MVLNETMLLAESEQGEGRIMGMMIEPRITRPVSLTFIPDIQYGEADGKPLLLDMFLPNGSSDAGRPCVIWLHGYGWFAGTRRDNLEISMCSFFAAEGFVAISIEYRLSDEAAFPAQLHDVKSAIRWVRANADAYHINAKHIGICGASAGGTLAALAGLTGDGPDLEGRSGNPGYSSQVQAVAVGSAPSDFLRQGGAMRNDVDGPVTRLFGGTVTEKGALMRLASPAHQVHAGAPPFLIAHGTMDETVPYEQSRHLYDALIAAGVPAELHPIHGVHHNWMMDAEGLPGRENTWKLGPLSFPFFREHLQARERG